MTKWRFSRPSPAVDALAAIRIQTGPFDVAAELAALTAGRDDVGGVGCFVGIVRATDRLEGGAVTALTLEHYPGMTERAMAAIAEQAVRRWGLIGMVLVHRVGRLEVGAPIVLVLTASAHRAPALEACAFLIDWLKTRAPFWKSESLADGTARWVEAHDADDTAAARWD